MENKIISKLNYSNKIYLFLLALYPVAIIFGNLFINLFIAFISLSFLVNLKSNKIFLKNNLFYLFVFLFISLMVNIIFSTNISNSVPRVLKIFFIIFFVFHIIKLIQLYSLNYIKYKHISFIIILIQINNEKNK